ncbi:CPBP family intramembrane metalloprotease [Natronococcus pandeyae]|uniref:CPBP family intramembrane metalloprotease n=1 Tax=Natronococcus pandeyae TaxID=2055836 RepID=A0A8J8TNN6_9EURY|nr:type II CAAX endopeptidase family protein [Natronococcus pandeyae]TYL36503.1 CPBP family intramembrane metalloprotease [Natronococcus pandeyae]
MGTPSYRRDSSTRALFEVITVTIGAIVAATIVATPMLLVADPTTRGGFVGLFVLNFVGMALAGWAYLVYTGRGLEFVDIRWPTRQDLGYAVGGSLAGIGLIVGFGVLLWALELPAASNEVIVLIGDDTSLLLALIPLIVLFNAPVEEFVFRNVVQKRLYAAYGRTTAIVVASVIFTLVHTPVFAHPEPFATVLSLLVIFLGSCLFGYVYAKTDSLFAPTVAHAAVNVFQVAGLYVYLEFMNGEVPAASALLGL